MDFFVKRVEKWSHLNDEELLINFHKTEDNTFFTELFSRYVHLAYYSCLKYLKSEEESREMVMHVFLKILEKTRNDKLELRFFKNWLFIIIKNECTEKFRQEKKSEKELNQYTEIGIDEAGSPHQVMEEQSGLKERQELIRKALEKLPQQQKICLELFFLQGRTYREIAQITDYPMNKVKSYLQNGKRKMKSIITKNTRT